VAVVLSRARSGLLSTTFAFETEAPLASVTVPRRDVEEDWPKTRLPRAKNTTKRIAASREAECIEAPCQIDVDLAAVNAGKCGKPQLQVIRILKDLAD